MNSEAVDSRHVVSEVSKVRLSEDDTKRLEEILLNPKAPNEDLKSSASDYNNHNKENIDNHYSSNGEDVVNELYQASEDENTNDDIENILDDELIEMIELKNDTEPEILDIKTEEIQELQEINDEQVSSDIVETVEQKEEVFVTPEPTQPEQIINSYNELDEKKFVEPDYITVQFGAAHSQTQEIYDNHDVFNLDNLYWESKEDIKKMI
jgi:Fe2+ transport system protein B